MDTALVNDSRSTWHKIMALSIASSFPANRPRIHRPPGQEPPTTCLHVIPFDGPPPAPKIAYVRMKIVSDQTGSRSGASACNKGRCSAGIAHADWQGGTAFARSRPFAPSTYLPVPTARPPQERGLSLSDGRAGRSRPCAGRVARARRASCSRRLGRTDRLLAAGQARPATAHRPDWPGHLGVRPAPPPAGRR